MTSPLPALDLWAARHPWQARLAPLILWVAFLPLIRLAEEFLPVLLPAAQGAQVTLTAALLWRWRRFFPEITLRFHWLALACAGVVLALWLALGWAGRGTFTASWQAAQDGTTMPAPSSPLTTLRAEQPVLGWSILSLRLLGMTLVVPLIEELFFRSTIVRAIPTWRALGRHLSRFPLLEWLGEKTGTKGASAADETILGHWAWPGVLISSLLFALNHQRADWAAAALTGLIWCGLTWYCNRREKLGLGPAIWSHALVNAGLWIWCVWRGDWGML